MRRAAQPFRPPQISILPQPTFGAVYSHSIAEAVKHPDHEHELSLETWDGRKAKVSIPFDTMTVISSQAELAPA